MEEEFSPAFKEVILAYGLASVLLWGLAAGIVLSLQLPQVFVAPLLQVAVLVTAACFAVKSAQALWLHLTEHYYIGDGLVRIQRGWASKTSLTIPSRNVRETWVVMPLLLKASGVGYLWILTSDCHGHRLSNLRGPQRVGEKIRPTQASEPVFRPSVG